MSKVITLRMQGERVQRLDALVAGGDYPSRAAVIIAAIDRLLEEIEEREIDRAIVDGYTRVPPTADETEWAEWSTTESVREEPW
jgi:Arc/MetJ-type ribon-helix-helix transcriptional regulator